MSGDTAGVRDRFTTAMRARDVTVPLPRPARCGWCSSSRETVQPTRRYRRVATMSLYGTQVEDRPARGPVRWANVRHEAVARTVALGRVARDSSPAIGQAPRSPSPRSDGQFDDMSRCSSTPASYDRSDGTEPHHSARARPGIVGRAGARRGGCDSARPPNDATRVCVEVRSRMGGRPGAPHGSGEGGPAAW